MESYLKTRKFVNYRQYSQQILENIANNFAKLSVRVEHKSVDRTDMFLISNDNKVIVSWSSCQTTDHLKEDFKINSTKDEFKFRAQECAFHLLEEFLLHRSSDGQKLYKVLVCFLRAGTSLWRGLPSLLWF